MSSTIQQPLNISTTLAQTTDILVYSQSGRSPQRLELRSIEAPLEHDVLLGKGNGTKHHVGNVHYRNIISKYFEQWNKSKKFVKPTFARAVLWEIRTQCPPGRFLRKGEFKNGENPGLYYDIGDDKAIKKIAQAFRDKASHFAKEMKASQQPTEKVDSVLPNQTVSDNLNRMERGGPNMVSILEGDMGDIRMDISALKEELSKIDDNETESHSEMTRLDENHGPCRISLADSIGTYEVNREIDSSERSNDILYVEMSEKRHSLESSLIEIVDELPSNSDEKCTSGNESTGIDTDLTKGERSSDASQPINASQEPPSFNDSSSTLEEWGTKFNDRTHRTPHSLENSLVLSQQERIVLSQHIINPSEAFKSNFHVEHPENRRSFVPDIILGASGVDTNSDSTLVNHAIEKDTASFFGQFRENISLRRGKKRNASLRDFIDGVERKKVKWGSSSSLYPMDHDLFLSLDLSKDSIERIFNPTDQTLWNEYIFKESSLPRDSDASDKIRNWISAEIRCYEEARISDFIEGDADFDENNFTEDEALDLSHAILSSDYKEDHGKLHETYLPAFETD